MVRSLLTGSRAVKELQTFDYLSHGPEIVSQEKFEEIRLRENEIAKKKVGELIEQLQKIDEYLKRDGATFRDEDIEMDLVAFSLDARFLRAGHVSAPERMTYDFEETMGQVGEIFYVRAMRHY